MIILMLAAAMTIAMLIATAFGLHHETARAEMRTREQRTRSLRLR